MKRICAERTPDPWDLDVHVCTLPATHVFVLADHWHRCSCGCTWVDDQQIDEARRRGGIFA